MRTLGAAIALVSLLACISDRRANAGTFDFSAYQPSTLSQAHTAVWADPATDYTFDSDVRKFRVPARYTGRNRDVTPEMAHYVSLWAEALGQPQELVDAFRSEIELESEGSKYWLPTQSTLVPPLIDEVAPGARAEFFIVYAGAISAKKVFLVNEFQAMQSPSDKGQPVVLEGNPYPAYWVTVHVILPEPLPVGDGPDVAVAYFQNLGVSCPMEALRETVQREIEDGTVDWDDSDVSTVDPSALDPEIIERIQPTSGIGVWYASGRAFHGPE